MLTTETLVVHFPPPQLLLLSDSVLANCQAKMSA